MKQLFHSRLLDMGWANSALVTRLVGYLSRILYPTLTRGIVFRSKHFIFKMKQMMLFNYV